MEEGLDEATDGKEILDFWVFVVTATLPVVVGGLASCYRLFLVVVFISYCLLAD